MKANIDLKRLRELAVAATPGPWEVSGTGQQVLKPSDSPLGNIRICESNSLADWYQGKTSCWANIAFIAAANPQAVIGMINRLDEAECAIRDLRMYWIGSYRGGESARRYALNWGLK